ncbi:hypothetical protein AB7V88_21770 [Providencia rettgeri]
MSESIEIKNDSTVTVDDLKQIISDAGGGNCPLCHNNKFDFVIDGNRNGNYLMPFVASDLYKGEDIHGMGAYFRIICVNCTHELTFNVSRVLNKLNTKNE